MVRQVVAVAAVVVGYMHAVAVWAEGRGAPAAARVRARQSGPASERVSGRVWVPASAPAVQASG